MDKVINFSNGDLPLKERVVFLQLDHFLGAQKQYNYMEVGSYLGGSLAPFLLSENCKNVTSIDKRGEMVDDERGKFFDYTSVTENDMVANLVKNKIPIDKLEMHNGDVSEYKFTKKYSLILIDGEHTNSACFSDYIYCAKGLESAAIIVFDDFNLVFEAVKNIKTLCEKDNIPRKLISPEGTRLALLCLGDYSTFEFEKIFSVTDNLPELFTKYSHEIIFSKATYELSLSDLILIVTIKAKEQLKKTFYQISRGIN